MYMYLVLPSEVFLNCSVQALLCIFLSLSLQEVAEILHVGGSESTYKDSNIFLKGTQSANPHNDYSQHFVDIGQRPQNFIRDVGKWAGLELHQPGLVYM